MPPGRPGRGTRGAGPDPGDTAGPVRVRPAAEPAPGRRAHAGTRCPFGPAPGATGAAYPTFKPSVPGPDRPSPGPGPVPPDAAPEGSPDGGGSEDGQLPREGAVQLTVREEARTPPPLPWLA